ncbi:MAG: sigma-70 factor domain-containing protein, partial [Cyanobium sp.]
MNLLGSSSGPEVPSAQGGGDLVRSYLRDIGRVPLLS